MALIPLKLPPGVYKNGTEFEQSNRWRDASLVRWSEGSMRPVGGWTDFVTSGIAAPPRGMHGWRDLDANNNLAAGTYEKLYAISSAGTVTDITPTSFTSGRQSATQNTGYGGGLYNVGSYSTPRVPSANWLPATTWAIDNFGEDLVACSSTDGKLHLWDVDGGGVAAPITNAPIGNQSLIVTEERFLFALGADNNPRKIQWCDKENLTSWTPAATNEAGDIEQDADKVMFPLRKAVIGNIIETSADGLIIVEKNRNGKTGDCPVKISDDKTRWTDYEDLTFQKSDNYDIQENENFEKGKQGELPF